jgi:glycerol-3-phosphate dehydrogenase (NAD(P)+)
VTRPLAVLGGGAWGTALAVAAASADRARPIILWMRNPDAAARTSAERASPRLPGIRLPDAIRPTADPNAFAEAEAALVAVPAQAVRSALAGPGSALRAEVPLILCAKGIERSTGLFLSDVARDLRPAAPVAILSGPSFAADVARGLPTAVTLAAHDARPRERLARVAVGPDLQGLSRHRRQGRRDRAAKNVLAIAAGIVEGRGLGESAKAALDRARFRRADALRIPAWRPAETLMGLSGLGDLVLTCASAASRTSLRSPDRPRRAPGDAAEGGSLRVRSPPRRWPGLGRAGGIEMPIAEAVAAVVAGSLSVEWRHRGAAPRPRRRSKPAR